MLWLLLNHTRGPFYQHGIHGLTLIPAWISHYTHCKEWDEMVVPLKFGNGYVISLHTLLAMWLLIHAGIKVNTYYKRGPRCQQSLYPLVQVKIMSLVGMAEIRCGEPDQNHQHQLTVMIPHQSVLPPKGLYYREFMVLIVSLQREISGKCI